MPAKIHHHGLRSHARLREYARHSRTRTLPTTCQHDRRSFSFFRFWSSDGEDKSRFRNLFDLGREYRIEAARERAKEMAAFAVIVLTSAWPVVYMIVTVVKLLSKGRPLT